MHVFGALADELLKDSERKKTLKSLIDHAARSRSPLKTNREDPGPGTCPIGRSSPLSVLAILFTTISAAGQIPEVTHVWPDAGTNGQSITAHVYGDSLAAVSSVKLVKFRYPDIDATLINPVSARYLTCSFDLTGGLSGLYALAVTNASGSDTLPGSFTVYSASGSPYIWVKTTVCSGGDWMYGVVAGDGNSDGEIEVYGANWDGYLYQLKWDGMSWRQTTVGSGGSPMLGVAAGDGDGDGQLEVYGGDRDGTIYQFEWDGTAWMRTTVGSGVSYMYAVAVGDGNGDGEMGVYGGNRDGNAYQFKWDGTTWLRTTVGSAGDWMYGVAIGDGDGNGEIEVYGASRDDNVYQFKWDGAGWVRTTVGTGGGWMYSVAVGDGNSDGAEEVYATSRDGTVYQFKWDGSGWVKTTVGSGGDWMYAVAVGDGNGDGQMDVWTGNRDNNIYEFRWDGASWANTMVGSGGNYMRRVAVGDGNDDGEMEAYGASYDGNIYQFKPLATGIEEVRAVPGLFSFSLKSNPAAGNVVFSLTVPAPAEITLQVYDAAGGLVDKPVAGRKLAGIYEIACTRNMRSGVYFYRLESPWGTKTGKLVLVR